MAQKIKGRVANMLEEVNKHIRRQYKWTRVSLQDLEILLFFVRRLKYQHRYCLRLVKITIASQKEACGTTSLNMAMKASNQVSPRI